MWQKIKPYIKTFVIAIAIPLAVGALSALLTGDNTSLYSEINSPSFAPPAILFPIVWSVLYVLMGVSSALVYINGEKSPTEARRGLGFYALSLGVNFLWSIIFFNLRLFLFAFFWLVLLLYLIIRTVICYFKVSKIAAFLQIPYILWVAFAGVLNMAIYLLN